MKIPRSLIMIGALLLCTAGAFPHAATRADQPAPPIDENTAPAIRLLGSTFVPSSGQGLAASLELDANDLPAELRAQAQYLVQFQGPILAAWRDELEKTGAVILDYIPDYAYKVTLGSASPEQLQNLPGVVWVGPFLSTYRTSPQLDSFGQQIVRVEMDHDEVDSFLSALPDLDATLIGRDGRTLVVQIDAARLGDLARLEGVAWIGPLQVPRPNNDVAAGEIQANRAWALGYLGDGQTINITDSGLDTGTDYPQISGDMHLDLDNRVSHLRSWPISGLYDGLLNNPGANDGAADLDSGHGTHVAGSAVGNGACSGGRYLGMAPHGQLTFQAVEQYCDFNALGIAEGFSDGYWVLGIPADLGTLYSEAYNWGARVQSNSWSLGEPGSYTMGSQQTDRFVWEHRDMVMVYAVGNDGQDANRDGFIDPVSVLPPATAKNIIAVGATENRRPTLSPLPPYQNYEQFSGLVVDPFRNDPMGNAGIDGLAAFSGRGPTKDGRLAPHVVAPGTWIASTRSSRALGQGWPSNSALDSDPHYVYMGGTSMSAPMVAGAATLVRQSYQSRGHMPSAALVKATLIQSATDIPGQYASPSNEAGPIPNYGEGWGAVNVERAVAPAGRYVDQVSALQTGELARYTYPALSSSSPAKITLVWTDYPAAVQSAVQLVNDLDLEVTTPDGKVYRGNVFSGGLSTTGGSADRLNNVECVYLPSAQVGNYSVTVQGHNVPQGPQNFALLVTMPFAPYNQLSLVPLMLRNYSQALPTPTPTLAPDEFRDDFSTISGRWLVTATQDYRMDYVDGAYRIQVSPAKRRVGSLVGLDRPGDRVLEIDGRAMNDVSQAYGLILSSDPAAGSSCAFLASPTGHFALVCWRGAEETTVVDWSPSDAINLGNGWNRLAVRRVGQQIECRINGVLVLTRTDATLSASRFGLVSFCFGEARSDARFDNFRMLPLGSSGPSDVRPLMDAPGALPERALPAPPSG
jgi:subtilisin family serine protease